MGAGSIATALDGHSNSVQKCLATDLDELINFIPRWNADYARISPGRFDAFVSHTTVGGMQFVYVRCNQSIQVTGLISRGCYSFTPIHSENSHSRFRTRFLVPGDVNILFPGEPMFHLSAQGFELSQVEIPADLVQQIGRDQLGVDSAELMAGRSNIFIGPLTCDRLFQKAKGILQNAECNLPLGLDLQQSLYDMTVDLVAKVLHDSSKPTDHSKKQVPRKSLFIKALSIMNSELGNSIRLAEICHQLDISERNLNQLFDDFIGISPKQYLNIIRLNRIRWDLKRALEPETVSEITQRWGVEYSGVFAAKYKQHFGDLPSETFGSQHRDQIRRTSENFASDHSR